MVGWNTKFRKHCKAFFRPKVHYSSQICKLWQSWRNTQ